MDDTELLLKLLEAERLHQLKTKDDLWYSGNLRFLLHEAQHVIYDRFRACNDRETVILASRRFGKSYLGVILCLEYAIRNPRTITRFIPPEIKEAWQIVMPTFMKLEESWPKGLIKFVASEKAWKIGRDSWLYLGGFDSQKDAQRGGEASFIVCDEAGFTNSEDYTYILRSVLKPQLLTTRGRMLIMSTPSREPDHPFMIDTVHDARESDKLHTFTIHDNPMLDQEQINQAIEDCGGEDTEDWQREYLCKAIRPTSLMVLPTWHKGRIKAFEPQPYHYRVLVGDFGGVMDKTVLHVLAYDYRSGNDGDVHIIDERHYDPGVVTDEIAKGIKELSAQWLKTSTAPEQDDTAYLDCPGQTQVDLSNYHGIVTRIPNKDNFHSSVSLINLYLRRNQLFVHPRCTHTITCFENARFNDKRNDYLRTKALGHCDAVASAIYGLRHLCRDRDGCPVPRIPKETHAYWKSTNTQTDRAKVAAAIYGGGR